MVARKVFSISLVAQAWLSYGFFIGGWLGYSLAMLAPIVHISKVWAWAPMMFWSAAVAGWLFVPCKAAGLPRGWPVVFIGMAIQLFWLPRLHWLWPERFDFWVWWQWLLGILLAGGWQIFWLELGRRCQHFFAKGWLRLTLILWVVVFCAASWLGPVIPFWPWTGMVAYPFFAPWLPLIQCLSVAQRGAQVGKLAQVSVFFIGQRSQDLHPVQVGNHILQQIHACKGLKLKDGPCLFVGPEAEFAFAINAYQDYLVRWSLALDCGDELWLGCYRQVPRQADGLLHQSLLRVQRPDIKPCCVHWYDKNCLIPFWEAPYFCPGSALQDDFILSVGNQGALEGQIYLCYQLFSRPWEPYFWRKNDKPLIFVFVQEKWLPSCMGDLMHEQACWMAWLGGKTMLYVGQTGLSIQKFSATIQGTDE